MNRRAVFGTSVAVALLVTVPVLAYAALSRHSRLDGFLERRVVLLKQLDINAMSLPEGFEHVSPPTASAIHPPSDHIRRVVEGGKLSMLRSYEE